jgi:hypothetical protein
MRRRTEARASGDGRANIYQASRNYACSHDFQEFNDTYGGNAKGQWGLIGGAGDYNQANYKKYTQENCSDATASDHETGFHY